ncbi:SDR family oxidoreductase [Emcibacter sp. SYSU 3D8]|uniref:SDR family NAD(P)-dependent oxidoreductase n=1 Tax=Emcibacter sp. SYSU 3D8 TaxID=3133969 RepID=UPI0031FE4BC2
MLTGKIAVVTGSAIGIGRGLCLALAQQGARVAALDIDGENNTQTARLVRDAGGECLPVACDVGDRHQVRQAMDLVLSRFTRIDLLVNNAAFWDNSSLREGTYDSQTAQFEQAISSCTLGSFNCSSAVAPALRAAGGGNIVNLITEHVKEGHYLTGRRGLGYDCAKFAQWRLTAVLAAELKPDNIRVNGLCFGATDTPMLRGEAPDLAAIAMKPEDLAQAVLNVVAHGPNGPTGETYLFGTSGTQREESVRAIAALAPVG